MKRNISKKENIAELTFIEMFSPQNKRTLFARTVSIIFFVFFLLFPMLCGSNMLLLFLVFL